jgi:predicted CoA-substrate-specific enzyme activase
VGAGVITLGYDIGTRFVKACIVEDTRIIGSSCIEIGNNFKQTLKSVKSEVIKKAGIHGFSIKNIVSTGFGTSLVKESHHTLGVASCIACAAYHLDREVRTIVDIGGLFINVISIDDNGNILDFYEVEKCAAGSGKFLETISAAIEIPLGSISDIALKSRNPYTMTSGCAVFAESEVISQVNTGAQKENILAGLISSIVSKTSAMLDRSDAKDKIVLTGGVSKFSAFKVFLERELKKEVFYLPLDAQLAAAYGAALIPSLNPRKLAN